MLLAIDAGNTNLVFALVELGGEGGGGPVIRTRWRIATDPRRTADQYAVWLHQLLAMEGFTRADVDAVIIGTVVPRGLHNLHVLSTKYFGVEPIVRTGRGGWGSSWTWSSRAPSARPGAERDRRPRLFGGDLIVVDFGTATTFDVVDYSGAYKGGIIAPGINLSLDALVSAAAKLPRIAIEPPAGRVADRPHHRGADADRHLLGLCRDDGGLTDRLKARSAAPPRSWPPAAWPSCSTSTATCSTRSSPILRSRALRCCTAAPPPPVERQRAPCAAFPPTR
jgi:type III pantothenate kinase